ncbi:MAG: hypothetical protein ABJL18_07920 [Hyphomicrobiales bacterium]
MNDLLCQIEPCWRYCIDYNRKLIIDSSASGLLDDFFNYFEPRDNEIIYARPEWLKKIILFLSSRRMSKKYYIDLWAKLCSTVRSITLSPDQRSLDSNYLSKRETFNMEVPHEKKILIHHMAGGGDKSIQCLERLKFTKKVSDEIINRLSKIEKSYSAVHIRNTDYQTDYVPFFEDIAPKVKGKNLLICSDDHACIEYAKKYFVDSRIMITSTIPDTDGKPLHSNKNLDRYQTNLDALVDLVALSLSDELHVCSHVKGELSGYSMLAMNLNTQKELVWELLRQN